MNCTSSTGATSPAENLGASESESESETIMLGLDQKRTKNHWTRTEDAMLTQLVEEANKMRPKKVKWPTIATFVEGRTGKQCRERWQNHLRPDLKKGSWSQEEDVILMKIQKKIGNKWSKIAENLPGRTDNDVKNRWYAGMRRKRDPASNPFDQANSSFKEGGDSDMCETETYSTWSTSAKRAKKGHTKPKVVKRRQQSKKVRGRNKKTTSRLSKPAMRLPDDRFTQSSSMKALKPSSVQNNHANGGGICVPQVPLFVGGNARIDGPHTTPQLLDKNQTKEDDTFSNPFLRYFSLEDGVTCEETTNQNDRNTRPVNLDDRFEDRTKLVPDINYTPGGPRDTATSNWVVDGFFSPSTVMHRELRTPLELSDTKNASIDFSAYLSTESSAGSAPPVPHGFSCDKVCEV